MENPRMRKVNIHEAKTTLSQLIEAAENGEDVLIARAGRPVARLTRVRTGRSGIKLGTLKGMFKRVSRDFDAPLPESVLSGFTKSSLKP
jgi:prevent-host-death family protein